MKALRNLFFGMSLPGEVLGNPPPYPSLKNGFARDRAALRGDVSNITRNFNQKISEEYGKQEYTA